MNYATVQGAGES
jgi:hypothetical protein